MIADMVSNKKLNRILSEISIREGGIKYFYYFYHIILQNFKQTRASTNSI